MIKREETETKGAGRTLLVRGLSFIVCLPVYFYRYSLAYVFGGRCRFTPSCSAYTIEAVKMHGVLRGLPLAASRVSRCHPWGGHGFDPVRKTEHR